MNPPQRGKTSSYRGRGKNVVAQIGRQQLIAANITSTSSHHMAGNYRNDPQYKEFLAYKASKEGTEGNTTSYSNVVNEENEDGNYDLNPYKEIILLLEHNDLKWKNQPWLIIQKYLDSGSYPAGSYKTRLFYETILSNTQSCDFNHFTSGNVQDYNFSKVIIKQIISAEMWGSSPLKERVIHHPHNKVPINCNYWDYIEAFNKAFLYENSKKKHSWFFKICPQVYNMDIPNWFFKWWTSYGPSIKILPEPFKGYFSEWVDISPKIINLQHDNIIMEGMAPLHYFMQFGIPWIWKWSPEVGYTNQGIPCLRRTFQTKFWKRILHKDSEGIMEGQETIDNIQSALKQYKEQIELQQQREAPSPFQEMAKRIQMMKGSTISKEEMLSRYLEEVKKDLKKHFQTEELSAMSTNSSSTDEILPGESQGLEDEDEVLDSMLQKLQKSLDKGKGQMSS